MAAGHLITYGNLTLLGNVDPDKTVYSRRKLVIVFPGENLNIDNLSGFAVRHSKGGITDLTGLLTKDRPEELFLIGKLGFSFGSDLTDQNIARTNFGANANDSLAVQILQRFFRNIGNLAGNFLRAKLCITGIALVFLNMNGCVQVALYKVFIQKDCVLIVVAFPRHIGNDDVIAQRQLTVVSCRAICNGLSGRHPITLVYDRYLIYAGSLVGTQEFLELVAVDIPIVSSDLDRICCNIDDFAIMLRQNHNAGVAGGLVLHTGANQRRLGTEKGYGLTLHICTHEGAVCIIVLQKRNHCRCNGNHLLRRYVHVVYPLPRYQHGILMIAGSDTGIDEVALLVQRFVCLGDYDIFFLIGSQVSDLLSNDAGFLIYPAIRRFHKAEAVNLLHSWRENR